MKRTSCSACGSDQLDQFLDLGMSPIADAYTATPDEISPTYPLQMAVCGKCKLVQLLEVVEDLFGTGYSFYSSASAPLSAYHAAYARDIRARYPEQVARGVVEIGCNDGDLLRHFHDVPHVGVDPSAGPVGVARGRGLRVHEQSFTSGFALAMSDDTAPGIVIANHVLAHVADVSDMLAGIAHLMDEESVAFIEVQYLPDLLVNNAFDLVYHEHRNFFSLTSLYHAAAQHGLFIRDAELTDRQGGSLRATLVKRGVLDGNIRDLPRSEQWLNDFSAYAGMQGRAERIRVRLLDLLAKESGTKAVYGAPAKATTLLNFLGYDGFAFCVDTTPAKQGRHIPGVGIPIVPPGDRAADVFLMAAWNYAAPIMRANPKTHWIVPIPAPVVYG